MGEVADRLHQRPARLHLAEQRPRDLGEPVGLAVAAAQQEDQRVDRQLLEPMLPGIRHDRRRALRCPAPGSRSQASTGRPARGSRGKNFRTCRDRCWRESAGSICKPSQLMRSACREGCTLTCRIIGVGCGQSYRSSKPARIFIDRLFLASAAPTKRPPWRRARRRWSRPPGRKSRCSAHRDCNIRQDAPFPGSRNAGGFILPERFSAGRRVAFPAHKTCRANGYLASCAA